MREEPDETIPIAERVRFWEEQDRINRELIPRVIRQHELMTGHIAEHENLPEVVARAISEALASAREEQQREFTEALDAAKSELAEQSRSRLQQVLTSVQRESRKTGNLLLAIAGGGALLGLLAVIIALVVG